MNIWIDAQLSPTLAGWIKKNKGVSSTAVRDLGLREAKDAEIFRAARESNAVVMTKDCDFPQLLAKHGPPPKILWITCGNTSNQNLRRILDATLEKALRLLEAGEDLVEITGRE